MNSNSRTSLLATPVFLLVIALGTISGCSGEPPGYKVYQKNCAQCHGRSGQGLKQLYPPLADSRYFSQEIAKLPCLIVNGSPGAGKKTMRTALMPPVTAIRTSELPDLFVFLQQQWSAESMDISQSMIDEWLLSCTP